VPTITSNLVKSLHSGAHPEDESPDCGVGEIEFRPVRTEGVQASRGGRLKSEGAGATFVNTFCGHFAVRYPATYDDPLRRSRSMRA
jgi:hypothetical protein